MLRWIKRNYRCLLRDIWSYLMNSNIERVRVVLTFNLENYWLKRVTMIQAQNTSIELWRLQRKLMTQTWRNMLKWTLAWLMLPWNGATMWQTFFKAYQTIMCIKKKTKKMRMIYRQRNKSNQVVNCQTSIENEQLFLKLYKLISDYFLCFKYYIIAE